jgi:prepilin-type processing-associated H-X9-DG protein
MGNSSDKENGKEGSSHRRWLVLLVLPILVLIYIRIYLQSRAADRAETTKAKSADNLIYIGLAIKRYAAEHGGEYPDNFATLLTNEDMSSVVFDSPQTHDRPASGATTKALLEDLTAGGRLSYVYLGRGLSENMADAGDVVVAYEKPGIFPTGSNVLFADGHVEFDGIDAVCQIAERAAAGEFPTTAP